VPEIDGVWQFDLGFDFEFVEFVGCGDFFGFCCYLGCDVEFLYCVEYVDLVQFE